MDDIAIRISDALEELERGESIEAILNGDCCKCDQGKAAEERIRKVIYRYLLQEEIALSSRHDDHEEYCKRFPDYRGITRAVFGALEQADQSDFPEMREFVVLGRLGTGGQGSAFKAYSIQLDRSIAIKLLEGSDAKRFQTEAQLHARLIHPNIVRVYDHRPIQSGERQVILMDYVDGPSLKQFLERKETEGKLSPLDAAQITRVVANAIAYAHKQLVIHRDVKPSNVLVEREGITRSWRIIDPEKHVRLMDFGVAKLLEPDATDTVGVIGTPAYMSPEQANGDSPSTLFDVYALGALLYHLTQGEPPFPMKSPLATLAAVRSEVPRFHHKLPKNLRTICDKCLSKDPADRYQSANDVAEELTRFISGYPIKATPPTLVERTALWCRRKPAAAAAFALAITLLIAIPMLGASWQFAELRASEATARADAEAANVALQGQEIEYRERLQKQEKFSRLLSEAEKLITERPRGWSVDALARLKEAARLDGTRHSVQTRSLTAACLAGVDVIESDNGVPTRVTTNVTFSGLPVPGAEFHPKRIVYSNDRRNFFVANHKGVACCIVRFDATTRSEVSQILVPSDFVKRFFAGARDGIVGGALFRLEEDEGSLQRTQYLDVMELSPNDEWLAAGLRNGLVCLWQQRTEQETSIDLDFHQKGVVAITFSPDSKSLYTGSSDGVIAKWKLSNGRWVRKCTAKMTAHDLCFANGELLVSVDDAIHKVDPETLSIIDEDFVDDVWGQLRLHVSFNGRVLAAAFAHTIWLIDVSSGEIMRTLTDPGLKNQAHENSVTSVNISRNGDLLVSSDRRNRTKLWDVGSGQLLTMIHHASQHDGQAIFSPDDGELMVISRTHAIVYTILGLKEGVVARQGISTAPVRAFDLSADRIVTLAGQNSVAVAAENLDRRHRAANTTLDGVLTWDLTPVNLVAMRDNNATAFFASPLNRELFVWNTDDGAIKQRVSLQRPLGLAKPTDANRLWVIDDKDLVEFEILEQGDVKEISRWKNEVFAAVFDGRDSVYSIAAEGDHAICGTRDGRVRVFGSGADLISGFNTIGGEEVHSVALYGAQFALAGLWNGSVLVHDLETNETESIEAHTASVTSIANSSKGLVATASLDGKVAVWDVSDVGELSSKWILRFAPLPPVSVRFSPNGSKLGILLRNDHCVRVFNMDLLDQRINRVLKHE